MGKLIYVLYAVSLVGLVLSAVPLIELRNISKHLEVGKEVPSNIEEKLKLRRNNTLGLVGVSLISISAILIHFFR